MRLGIFGDSYADVNEDTSLSAWPNLLAKKSDFCAIKARCGVSHYWTYQQFIDAIEKHQFTHIVFCHTSENRWPCLPVNLEGSNWNIHNVQNPSFTNDLRLLNKYYLDLFPDDFTRFISKSIFQNVNDYCRKNNIFLINIVCFENSSKFKSEFPLLVDLNTVSYYEHITYKNKRYSYEEFLKKYHLNDGDPRQCHMGNLNNKRLANIITNLFDSRQYNIEYNLSKEFEWDTDDISNDILFTKILEKQIEAHNDNRL
jgi:hypothetical protein